MCAEGAHQVRIPGSLEHCGGELKVRSMDGFATAIMRALKLAKFTMLTGFRSAVIGAIISSELSRKLQLDA
jgi:hypothetical protein